MPHHTNKQINYTSTNTNFTQTSNDIQTKQHMQHIQKHIKQKHDTHYIIIIIITKDRPNTHTITNHNKTFFILFFCHKPHTNANITITNNNNLYIINRCQHTNNITQHIN